mmetsp:Transcript_17410/g.37680  ORF Transcript_17410/g.37680 Transcript_17410/m.37680 type:complete len:284 (+) Transcript_17410:61-912(+)
MVDDQNQTINSIHHIGDLSYACGAGHIWDAFMDMIQPFAARVPMMVGVGNKEYDHTAGGKGKDPSGMETEFGFQPTWGTFGTASGGECGVPISKRFAAPENGNGVFWYSYSQSLVHTVVLSSEHNLTIGSDQYNWFEHNLQSINRTTTPWVVVETHRPLYNSDLFWDERSVGIAMQEEIEDLLYEHEVDLVLSGHYHSYLRTCNGLYRNSCYSGGPTHITVGTGGAPLGKAKQIPNKWTEFHDHAHHGIGRASVFNESSLHWEFVAVGGNVIDEVWIERTRSS